MLEEEMPSYLKELRDNGTLHCREVLMLIEVERLAKIFNRWKTRAASVQDAEWLRGKLEMLEYFRKFIINTAQNKKANDKYEKMVEDFIANPTCKPNERKFLDEIREKCKRKRYEFMGDSLVFAEELPVGIYLETQIHSEHFPDVNLSELVEGKQ